MRRQNQLRFARLKKKKRKPTIKKSKGVKMRVGGGLEERLQQVFRRGEAQILRVS